MLTAVITEEYVEFRQMDPALFDDPEMIGWTEDSEPYCQVRRQKIPLDHQRGRPIELTDAEIDAVLVTESPTYRLRNGYWIYEFKQDNLFGQYTTPILIQAVNACISRQLFRQQKGVEA